MKSFKCNKHRRKHHEDLNTIKPLFNSERNENALSKDINNSQNG